MIKPSIFQEAKRIVSYQPHADSFASRINIWLTWCFSRKADSGEQYLFLKHSYLSYTFVLYPAATCIKKDLTEIYWGFDCQPNLLLVTF